jgi:hypothetical protein
LSILGKQHSGVEHQQAGGEQLAHRSYPRGSPTPTMAATVQL